MLNREGNIKQKHVDMLRKLSFMEGVSTEVLARLAGEAEERRVQPGEVVFEEGSTGSEIFIMIEGKVEVVKGHAADEVVLAQRGPGDVFGEMAYIEASARFATVRAIEPTSLLVFSEQDMNRAMAQQPLLVQRVVRMLSARLRQSEIKMIADLQRKNLELSRAYQELKEAQASLVEKERLERELELARELQQSILPHEFPRLPGFRCAGASRPARQVGGDFFDVFLLKGGCVGLVMADVSDKGMVAALFMALTRSLIRAEARRKASPRRVLLSVNRLLLEMSRSDMFVTVFYAIFDPQTGVLRYARAGHDLPLVLNPASGECRALNAAGTTLGIFDEIKLDEASVELQPGEILVLYTDGITDANSPDGAFYGKERLIQQLAAVGSHSPRADGNQAQAVCDLVFESVTQFQAQADQFDDMTLLVVEAVEEAKFSGR